MFSSSTREALWAVSQVTNFSINVTTDSQDAVDATGTPIHRFYRAKQCEVSAENALFDFNLLAAQGGGDQALVASTSEVTYNVPIFDEITLASATSATLTHTPVVPTGETYGLPFIYVLNGDGTLGKKLTCAGAAATGKFTQSGTSLTFYSGDLAVGDTIIAFYDYTANGTSGNQALRLQNTAKDFPRAGRFVIEALGIDPCSPTDLIYFYLILPNAALSPDIDISFATDGTHPFSLVANQAYCDKQKMLFEIVIPEAA